MENIPMPQQKKVSPKAKWISLVVIFLLIVGGPVTFFLLNKNQSGTSANPDANKVTINYYRFGQQIPIQESDGYYISMELDVQMMLNNASSFSPTSATSMDVSNAMQQGEAVEVLYGSRQFANFYTITQSTDYDKLLIVKTGSADTVRIIIGYDTYTSREAIYTGSTAKGFFDSAYSVYLDKRTNQ